MNKKYLSVILFGALMLGTTGTFTSCKDYDDDINQINKELTDIKSAISELQSKVDNGKYVTNITKEGEGIKITWNDNSTSVIETIKGDKGADGTIVTIIDGYWAFDGVKSEYPAVGKDGADGADGQDGQNGQDGHDAKISEDGYWMVWDAEKGEYTKTEYIAGGATAIAGEHGWTIVVRDENGQEQRIYIPNSAELVGIQDVKDYSNHFDIFYGIVNQAVDWDGAKGGADKKMQAGMYPVLEEDVMVMLNPTGVDATAYKFDFRASDNKELWGLTFGDMKPYEGDKLTRATSSESGIWVLPRDIARVELNELDARADYVTQFKQNNGSSYAFALNATSKADASQVIKSQYIYTFDPKNIGDLKASDFTTPQRDNYAWNVYHKPTFISWAYNGGAVGDMGSVNLGQVIYDYKIEIDKTQMTQVNIDKYGLEISEDGYSFIATKEAAIDNDVYLKISYILVNGSKYTRAYTARITAKDMVITDTNIGTINEAFNAVYTTNSKITDLNGKYVLGAKELAFNPKEVLGTNYDEWVDAMYMLLNGYTNAGKAYNLKQNVSILGGDPINNDATYNNYLVRNLLYFDYVDANGKSCIYDVQPSDVLSKLADIAAVKVYFIAGTYNLTTGTITQQEVIAPFYTVTGTTSYSNGFAIPLNNAFSVQVATAKEEQVVAAFTFKFQLTMPTCPITRVKSTADDKSVLWTKDADNNDVLKVYGERGTEATKLPNTIFGDLRDAFTGAFDYEKGEYVATVEAGFYDIYVANVGQDKVLLGQFSPAHNPVTLADITTSSLWSEWNTWQNLPFDGADFATMVAEKVVYNHFGVYQEELPMFYVQFASKIEDGEGALVDGKGEVATPLMAQPVYNGSELTAYEVIINDANFDMKDAFGYKYYMFDSVTVKDGKAVDTKKRNALNNMWANDREGLKDDSNTYYGLNPTAKVDGNPAGSLVKFNLLTWNGGVWPTDGTYATQMKITIDKSVAAAKNNLVEVTLNVTDVFGHVYELPIYIQTVK